MKYKVIAWVMLAVAYLACAGESTTNDASGTAPAPARVDDGKGIGEIKQVSLNDPLDANMIKSGKAIFEMKCAACHKLTATRIVGPGMLGVTERRKPEWIMNMITNVDVMLAEDAEAQKLLEECLTRMPNQNLSVGDARDVLEYLYENDKQS